ncbi:MAG: hypothetical protein ACXVB9_02515 [Bdellovibrionota bacterium]
MKSNLTLAFSLVMLLISAASMAAEAPVSVEVNNPAYLPVVKAYFASHNQPIVVVKKAPSENFVRIVITQDFSFGASCTFDISEQKDGMESQLTASRSNSFVFPSHKLAYCQKALADTLGESFFGGSF